MVVTLSTATAAQVQAVVKTGMSTSDIETLLDYVVYPIVDSWAGGHSLNDEAQRITAAELIMACYFVRQRDPSSRQHPGGNFVFETYKEAERIARSLINRSVPYDKAIRVVEKGQYRDDYVLRDPDAPKSHSPPF